jgi:branched-chain amino acid transport system substrate-binding protein
MKRIALFAGLALDGTLVPVGPNLVAEQLPDSHPSKKPALEYIRVYEGQHGAGSRSLFGALTWTAWFVLDAATGVYNWTATDHAGLDDRAVVILRIQDGSWRLAP